MRMTCAAMASMAVVLTAAQARAGELECSSLNYRYQVCRADTGNNVQLAQQLSHGGGSCKQGRDWGYDQRGIWVDNGCRAMFTYGSSRHGHDSGRDVAAGLGAAVILEALVSQGGQHHHHDDNPVNQRSDDNRGIAVPAWAVGHFAGSDREGGPDIELAIDPDGRINVMQGEPIGYSVDLARQLAGKLDACAAEAPLPQAMTAVHADKLRVLDGTPLARTAHGIALRLAGTDLLRVVNAWIVYAQASGGLAARDDDWFKGTAWAAQL